MVRDQSADWHSGFYINKTLTFHEQIKNTPTILYTQQSKQNKTHKLIKTNYKSN